MTLLLKQLLVATALACAASAQPVIAAVLNAASYEAFVSPGCLITIFGSNLSAPSDKVSVTIAGLAAPLLYVSPSQINTMIPFETVIPANTVVPVVLNAPTGSVTYNIRLTPSAPALFTRNGAGTGRAFVFNPDFQPVDTIAPQNTVILYATGLGPTDASGRLLNDPEVYIGERRAEVLFAGLAPGFPGVYQLNVIAPAPATDRLFVRTGAFQSNIVDIGIRAGANTANITGAIDGLYPSSDPFFTLLPCVGDEPAGPCSIGQAFSIMLHAGIFSVSFDILPAASPFEVAAVGAGGGSIISINPATRTYTASIATLSAALPSRDFSLFVPPVVAYFSCNPSSAVCPVMGVPPPVTDPLFQVARVLPIPVETTPTSPNAMLQLSGALTGSRFTVDAQTNTALSRFGSFVQVPYGPFDLRTSTFKLYVDGQLIAEKDLPYRVFHR